MKQIKSFLVLSALLTAFQAPSANAQQREIKDNLILNVIDGDTLKIVETGERIRLLGIDACEHGQKAKSKLGQTIDCGIEPTAALIRWTTNQIVHCEFQGRDVYDRHLAICGNDQIKDFSAELVRQGLAVVYLYRGRPTIPDYVKLETQARQKAIGIWALSVEKPRTYRHHKVRH